MSNPYQIPLLRRTLAAIAAAAFVFTASDVLAQGKVKLTNAGGKDECAYSSMSITPDGSVTVQCSGTNPPPPPPPPPPPVDNSIPGVFSMSNAAMSAGANSAAPVSVMRTGGGLATTLYYWYTGNGCKWYDAGALNFGTGVLTAFINVQVTAAGTTCTVNLAPPPSPGTLGAQTTTTITVTGSVDPGPVANPNCPAGFSPPQNLLRASFAGLGNPLLQMQASGQLVAITLPNLSGLASGQVTFGESAGGAYTPQPVTLEVSINKCPGYIDTNYTNSCNLRSTNGNYNSLAYLVKAVNAGRSGNFDANNLPIGYCWAGDSATYYVNTRWSYASCAFGAQVCGFAIQYNQGAY